jgi:hypothetical protein
MLAPDTPSASPPPPLPPPPPPPPPSSAPASSEAATLAAPRFDTTLVSGDYLLSAGVPPASGPDRRQPYVYTSTFYPNAATSAEATIVRLEPGDERTGVDFDLRPVPTHGVAGLATADGAPAANVMLQLLRLSAAPSGRPAASADIEVATSLSAPDGRFVFPAVPAGQFLLRATRLMPTPSPGDAPAQLWATMPLTVADDVSNVVVALRPGFAVSGQFVFDGSSPRPPADQIARAAVMFEALDQGETMRSVRAGPDGRFGDVAIAAGNYLFQASALPAPWILKSVTVGGKDVSDRVVDVTGELSDVVLTLTDRPASVRGRVAGTSGADRNASVLLFPAGVPSAELAWSAGSRRFRYARVDAAGAYTFGGLPPGDYLVVAVPDEVTANWSDARFLTEIAPLATILRVDDGESRTQDLRTVQVRR